MVDIPGRCMVNTWCPVMAKKKDWKKSKVKYDGFVYILKIAAPGGPVFKPGTTNRKPKTRMLEIAGELFEVLGYIPKIELLRKKQTKDNYKIEAEVLRRTAKHRCSLGLAEWGGESELRRMDQDELLAVYDKCLMEGFAPTKKFEVGM